MIVKGPTAKHGIRAAYSPDGIHWREGSRVDLDVWRDADGSQSFDLPRSTDVVALVINEDDPDPERPYKIVWQAYANASKPGPQMVRTKCIGYGPDIEHFTANRENPILHPNNGLEQENHFLMLASCGGQYLLLYEYGWYISDETGRFGRYAGDIRLASSQHGRRFQRILPQQKVIARGPRGAWDGGFLVIADKPVVRDDKVYLFYAGSGEERSSWPTFGNKPDSAPLPNTGCLRPFRMGLATLCKDRFTCMETTGRETLRHFTTDIIELPPGKELQVNLGDVQSQRCWMTVEVLEPTTGHSFPGFDRYKGEPLVTDNVRHPVRWGGKGLGELVGKQVCFHFWLFGAARLYSYQLV